MARCLSSQDGERRGEGRGGEREEKGTNAYLFAVIRIKVKVGAR